MFKNKHRIGALVVLVILAISAFSWIAIRRSNETQENLTGDLTNLGEAEISA
jgi:hypothetical protein